MSKGKKGNKATPEAVSWDDGLVNAPIEEVYTLINCSRYLVVCLHWLLLWISTCACIGRMEATPGVHVSQHAE